jgi:hypothetical protein
MKFGVTLLNPCLVLRWYWCWRSSRCFWYGFCWSAGYSWSRRWWCSNRCSPIWLCWFSYSQALYIQNRFLDQAVMQDTAGSQFGGSGSHLEGSVVVRWLLMLFLKLLNLDAAGFAAGWTIKANRGLNLPQLWIRSPSQKWAQRYLEIVQEIDQEIITETF